MKSATDPHFRKAFVTDTSPRTRLIALYAQLAAHTEPECSGKCERPRTCCEERYCVMAIEFAKTRWHVDLTPTWHPALPLMGDDGCTAAPHLRPTCTAHTCEMCTYGAKRGDPAWTARYADIMREIDEVESVIFEGAQ